MITTVSFAKTYTVGFAQDTLKNDWRLAQVNELKAALSKHDDIQLLVKNAESKVSKQILHIEQFIKDGVDFIVTSPIEQHITATVLEKAMQKGIHVILIDRRVQGDAFSTFIAPDNKLIAKEAGGFLVDKLDQKGVILMLQGIENASATTLRDEGFMEVANKYPKIKVIKKRANFLRNDAIKVMEEVYEQGVHFDAIYSHSDSMLVGARKVMKRLGKPLDIPMVGIDYIQEAKEAILQGEQTASFIYQTSAKEGAKAIVDIINGKLPKKEQTLDTVMVTKENVQTLKPIF